MLTSNSTTEQPTTTCVLYIRGLKREVKDQFKSFCAARGVTMTEQIEAMIRNVTKQDMKGARDIRRLATGTED